MLHAMVTLQPQVIQAVPNLHAVLVLQLQVG